MRPLADTLKRLRSEAGLLRRRSLEREARLVESIIEEIEIALHAYLHEELNLRQAAEESGFSRKRLREMVKEGKLPDHRENGSQGEIQVRRCDLPRKASGARKTVSAVDSMAEKLQEGRT